MKPATTLVIIILCLLAGCSSKDEQLKSSKKTSRSGFSKRYRQMDATECDSTKFPDFKNNIKEIEVKERDRFKNEIHSIAKEFKDKECEKDTSNCDDMYFSYQKEYRSSLGYELFAYGYTYKGYVAGMTSEESASFFVFGIRQRGKIIFYDIISDLHGEVQFKLSGLEKNKDQIVVWGEMYLYNAPDYGKFKLTLQKEQKKYEYQCKARS